MKNIFGEEVQPAWTELWEGMPEFRQEDLTSFDHVDVYFREPEDRRAFLRLLGDPTVQQKAVWWPPQPNIKYQKKAPAATPPNKYPVYVISKGRWETRHTSRALETLGIPYRIVVEPQEFRNYAAVIDRRKILRLPFSNLGQGSIPARNWVWEHSLANGDARHWILDDNIQGFYRLNDNKKEKITGGENPFAACEEFSDRYRNVAISGLNYFMFAPRKDVVPPLYLNTRVYSCILIKNDLPHRWRGRYNEDTDLCLRVLKDGWCTVLFNAYLALKMTTMTVKGGNTDELYAGDGRLEMAKSLQRQHPDLVKITRKWGRWQHQVSYKGFLLRNKLIPI